MPDCLIRAGTYSWMPPLPATPGTELAGIIEKVGAGVTSRQVGQRVYTTARERPHRGGHYADYVATPAEATFLLPDDVAFDAAAALANYQVAYHIFNDALALRQGQTVLIYAAAGGMGNALIDLAKVARLDRDRRRLERSQGALRPRAWRRSRHRPQDRKSRRRASARSRAAAASMPSSIRSAAPSIPGNLALLAPCGTLVVYGGLGGKAALDLQTTMRASKNSPAIRQFSIHTWDHLVEERRAGMRALIDMLAAGKLKPRIHAKLPLAEAARAHEMLEGGEVLGKLLLVP